MTAEEICKIIEVSYRCNIKTFALSDLKFELRDTQGSDGKRTSPEAETSQVEPLADEEIKQIERKQLLIDNKSLREMQLDQLSILNPEQYEQLITSEELVNVEENDDSGIERDLREGE